MELFIDPGAKGGYCLRHAADTYTVRPLVNGHVSVCALRSLSDFRVTRIFIERQSFHTTANRSMLSSQAKLLEGFAFLHGYWQRYVEESPSQRSLHLVSAITWQRALQREHPELCASSETYAERKSRLLNAAKILATANAASGVNLQTCDAFLMAYVYGLAS